MKLIGFMQGEKIYAKVLSEATGTCIGCAFVNDEEGCLKAPRTCEQANVVYKEILISESE